MNKVDSEAIMLSEGDNLGTLIVSASDFENIGEQDCIVYITGRVYVS
jgi:hypothetical protein